jgi:hypothetical protein
LLGEANTGTALFAQQAPAHAEYKAVNAINAGVFSNAIKTGNAGLLECFSLSTTLVQQCVRKGIVAVVSGCFGDHLPQSRH